MKLIADYFNSPELKAWTDSQPEVDITDLSDFFAELFLLYEADNEGRPIAGLIQEDWDLFSPTAPAEDILNDAFDILGNPLRAQSKVIHSADVLAPIAKWKNIKEELRTNRRFFASRLIDEEEDRWNEMLEANKTIEAGQTFFRGRTNTEEDKPFSTEQELSAPPVENATPGRANPYGIPYLYLTNSEVTMLYELRSVSGDQISIGEFAVTQDLQIVNFSYHPDIFNIYADENATMLFSLQKKLFLEAVSEDMSKPIRRYDDENLDYLPTQFVCEYIRLERKADGIEFPSSRFGDGYNVVLFDKNKARLLHPYQKTVGRVTMEFENMSKQIQHPNVQSE